LNSNKNNNNIRSNKKSIYACDTRLSIGLYLWKRVSLINDDGSLEIEITTVTNNGSVAYDE